MADLGGDDVDPAGLGEGQEGAEAQQVDGGDEGEHGRPRACGLDEIPREINHQDPCAGKTKSPIIAQRHKQSVQFCQRDCSVSQRQTVHF